MESRWSNPSNRERDGCYQVGNHFICSFYSAPGEGKGHLSQVQVKGRVEFPLLELRIQECDVGVEAGMEDEVD